MKRYILAGLAAFVLVMGAYMFNKSDSHTSALSTRPTHDLSNFKIR